MNFMIKASLVISALLLVLYPFWGIFYPESYANEIIQHHGYTEGFSLTQVKLAAAWQWPSNIILAAAFFLQFEFLKSPDNTRLGMISGICFVLYPFTRVFTEVMIEKTMLAQQINLVFSSEKLFYVVIGLLVIGLTRLVAGAAEAHE